MNLGEKNQEYLRIGLEFLVSNLEEYTKELVGIEKEYGEDSHEYISLKKKIDSTAKSLKETEQAYQANPKSK